MKTAIIIKKKKLNKNTKELTAAQISAAVRGSFNL